VGCSRQRICDDRQVWVAVVSIAAAMMMLIPPIPMPTPWQPEHYPEYEADCHVVDKSGQKHLGQLKVYGQGGERRIRLQFDNAADWPPLHEGRASPFIYNPVSDGTYRFSDNLSFKSNRIRFGVGLEALGPSPDVLILTIIDVPKSPVFEEPALIGLCVTKNVKVGTKFSPDDMSRGNPK